MLRMTMLPRVRLLGTLRLSTLRLGTLLLGTLLLGACQSSPKTDYDPKVNFAQMKRFALVSPPQTSDPLSSERIRAAVSDTLSAKGMTESNNAEFKVTWAFENGTKPSSTNLSIGLGTGSWGHSGGIGVGTSIGIPLGGETLYQVIQIDVLNAEGNKLLWRGTDGAEFSESGDKTKATQEAVAKILANFPPKSE